MLPVLFTPESHLPPQRALHNSPESQEKDGFSLIGKRAVIVEDEGMTQLQLRRILQSKGVEVVGLAANGREAIEIVLAEKPDLVLMDVQMPVMDGLEAARQILANYRVCIVMLTAFSEEEYLQKAQEIGACGYIIKPVTADLLLPQLTVALRNFSTHSE